MFFGLILHRYCDGLTNSPMKILVTGGAGFIGSHVVDRYLKYGHNVIVIDNLSTGNLANLPKKVKFYQMDIGSDQLATVFDKERPDIVNHLAAQIDVRKSVEDPVSDANINIIGSLNLLKLCQRYRVKKVIFSSSGGAIYGEHHIYPSDETHPTEPQSPYGIAKLTIEKYLQFYARTCGMSFAALRYANVYGPRQNTAGEAGVVAVFTRKLLNGEVPTIHGDGKQTRDCVYVDDVVHCNVEALKPEISGIFHVGTGIETDVTAIANKLIQLTESTNIKPNFGPAKDGEARRSCLKPGKLQKMPPTLLSVGLEKTVQWFKAESKQ